MARKKKSKADRLQMTLPGFGGEVDQAMKDYKAVGKALNDVLSVGPKQHGMENEFELGQELAVAIKQEIRAMGISRDQFCDLINKFLGRTAERYRQRPRLCRKPLTKATLDKMISDPIQYPLDAYYLFAFQHITGSFGVVDAIVGAKGAKVVSGEDLRKFALIKAQELRQQAQALEKSIGRM